MSGVKLNCLVLIGKDMAIRADEVRRVDIGLSRTRIIMEDGVQYSTSMPVSDVTNAINIALNSARSALSTKTTGGE